MAGSPPVFLLSDATGETAEKMVLAALTQFGGHGARLNRISNVRSKNQVYEALDAALAQRGLVVYTIVNRELAQLVHDECDSLGLPCLDLLTPLLMKLSAFFGVSPRELPGLLHGVDEEYFRRIEAVEFTVKHDDGQEVRHLAKADIVSVPVQWHFIGHLQSNKVKYLPGKVAMIHSVDRLSLAEEIDRQWGARGLTAEILIEVNLGGESSKSGVHEAELEPLLRRLSALSHLAVRGLMTLPPYCDDPEEVRPYFRRLRELAKRIEALSLPGVVMRELSMGMSHDFAVAIEEGATLVRIGTAIFGERGG
jgi:pyridoxal phosphate enzyme (YggS family)